jgi:CubicO group peptidase (beta-lactamase class C family)
MKKRLIIPIFVVLFVTGFTYFLKFPPWQLGNAVQVATALGAKLACSGYYVSGFSEPQVMDDLAGYSPVTRLLELEHKRSEQRVVVSMFGLGEISASYRTSLGCTLDIGDTRVLDNVDLSAVQNLVQDLPVLLNKETLDPALQALVEQTLAEDNQSGFDTRAVVVLKNNVLVAEAYAKGFSKDTAFLGWSMGKSVTAALIGNLIYQGQFNESDDDLFEEWTNDERRQIRLDNLLTMTSGLQFNETYSPGSDSTEMLFSVQRASSVPVNSKSEFSPGQHHSYSSGTTNLLSRLIFNTFNQDMGAQYQHLASTLQIPLSLSSLVFEPDPSGVIVGSSYIYASARDWAKMGALIANKGEFNDTRIFSTDFANAMLSPNGSENETRYGYQLWLNTGEDKLRWPLFPKDAASMQGSKGQYVLILPSNNAVVVRLGWTSKHYDINKRLITIVDALQ